MSSAHRTRILAVFVALGLGGCTDDGPKATVDTGVTDTFSASDGSAMDTAASDSVRPDAKEDFAPDSAADARPVPDLSPMDELLSAKRVLFVGAHPDDETVVAPLLAHLCLENKAECHLLMATRGEKGNCGLPTGCHPDLATVRDQEMKNAAAIYKAQLVHWDLGDGTAATPTDVGLNWAAKVGGVDKLAEKIALEVRRIDPDLLLTFDPRHGWSCHADHRAIAQLTLRAVSQLQKKPASVMLLAGRLEAYPQQNPTEAGMVAIVDDPLNVSYDATTQLSALGDSAWSILRQQLGAHPSQFAASLTTAVENARPAWRIVPLLPLWAYREPDPRYQNLCP